jgi:hypothetical protein
VPAGSYRLETEGIKRSDKPFQGDIGREEHLKGHLGYADLKDLIVIKSIIPECVTIKLDG